MANEKHWLIFPDKPTTKVFIDEPINFGDVDFQLNRKENGHGFDASISGGELKFRFTIYRNHYLEDILYLNHKDGFEANLIYGFESETGDVFTGEVDFYTAETNDVDYFECSVILESELQVFKRRAKTKVDLFSNTTIDGEAITPLEPITMLLQAKPVEQISEWTQKSETSKTFVAYGQDAAIFSLVDSEKTFGINNSLVPFYTYKELHSFYPSSDLTGLFNDIAIVEINDNLSSSTLKINKLNINIIDSGFNTKKTLKVSYSKTFINSETKTIILEETTDTLSITDKDYEIPLDTLDRGIKICVYISVFQPYSLPATKPVSATLIYRKLNETVSINGLSVAYNSTPLAFRLIDVMRQVAKSSSGLEINAPRYDFAGQFYDNVITNGKLLGGNRNDPFYVSWEDLEKSFIPEHNADSEIQIDKRIFVGIEKDYYTNEECGFFDNTQFSGLTKKINPLYCLNEFKFKYEKYQSLKEATEPNSGSTIHGESILTPFNKKVENSKECSVNWTRDAILLDVQQRLSTNIPDDTATQDDDTLFAIDTIETTEDKTFTETTSISHTFTNTLLSLRNDGSVNFLVLGIRIGSDFTIEAPDTNSGLYTVSSVINNELQLIRVSGNFPSTSTNGVRLTKYTYTIKKEDIPLTNRTDEGFSVVLNINSSNKYSNLRYSVQRNIKNYWNSFLATVNLYHKSIKIKNTFYKNNGKCETEYDGLRVIEKEDFIPTEPIVTPFMYENIVFANVDFSDFVLLQNNIRTRRGFIRTIDNNNRVLKVYPNKMTYKNKGRELTITGQERFEKAYLEIVKQNSIITINNETKLIKLSYSIEDGNKVVLFDNERQRLYNGIYWDKVSINNYISKTLPELIGLLDLL